MHLFVVVGLLLLVLSKWGVIDYVAMHAPIYLYKVINCKTCLTFWTSLIYFIPIYFIFSINILDFLTIWAISYIMYK